MSAQVTTPNEQARQGILRAQQMIAATEGRTLDFETADEINRALLSSINALPPADEPDFTDEEWLEIEMRLSRDHDDAAYWAMGGTR
jgi:hypothetical protein